MTHFERGKGGKKLLTSKPKQCNIKNVITIIRLYLFKSDSRCINQSPPN